MRVAEANLAKLGIALVSPNAPLTNYVPYTYSMGSLYISGQMSFRADGTMIVGQCGRDISVDDAVKAARACGIYILSQIKLAVGSLDRVKKVVKITCMVNSTSEFTQHPVVANGCSDLLVEVFGPEVGRHARCAVGMAQLPYGAAVEIDAIVEVEGHPDSL